MARIDESLTPGICALIYHSPSLAHFTICVTCTDSVSSESSLMGLVLNVASCSVEGSDLSYTRCPQGQTGSAVTFEKCIISKKNHSKRLSSVHLSSSSLDKISGHRWKECCCCCWCGCGLWQVRRQGEHTQADMGCAWARCLSVSREKRTQGSPILPGLYRWLSLTI